jgi:hypothetical protein
MKETYYFSHDYHARHDIKMEALSMEQVGIYWCIIEMLYEENGYINLSLCERIATALRTQCDTIMSVIQDYQLFENDGKQFWSNSVLRRLKFREEKSNKARISARKRWDVCERNAIKERKGKESKVNNMADKSARYLLNDKPISMEDLTYEYEDRVKTPKKYSNKRKLYSRIAIYYMGLQGEAGNVLRYFKDIKELVEIAERQYPDFNEEKIEAEIKGRINKWRDDQLKKDLSWGLSGVITHWNRILKS